MTSYKIAAGKAVTSKRGILAEGEAVTAADFPGGQKSLDALVESGAVDALAPKLKPVETPKSKVGAKRKGGK